MLKRTKLLNISEFLMYKASILKCLQKNKDFERCNIKLVNTNNLLGLNKENYTNTILNMRRYSKPIIAEGVLFNKNTKAYVPVDLIVRSNVINRLFGKQIISDPRIFMDAPLLEEGYNYRIITFQLFSNINKFREYQHKKNNSDLNDIYLPNFDKYNDIHGNTLRNYHKFRSEELNKLLEDAQGYVPDESYVFDEYQMC